LSNVISYSSFKIVLPSINNCHPGEVTPHFSFLITNNRSVIVAIPHATKVMYMRALLEHIGYAHRKACKKSPVITIKKIQQPQPNQEKLVPYRDKRVEKIKDMALQFSKEDKYL
jgi:hypothetical protein